MMSDLLKNFVENMSQRSFLSILLAFYEQLKLFRSFGFVKISADESSDNELPQPNTAANTAELTKFPTKKKEDRDRGYNIETEPDLRRDAREEAFSLKG